MSSHQHLFHFILLVLLIFFFYYGSVASQNHYVLSVLFGFYTTFLYAIKFYVFVKLFRLKENLSVRSVRLMVRPLCMFHFAVWRQRRIILSPSLIEFLLSLLNFVTKNPKQPLFFPPWNTVTCLPFFSFITFYCHMTTMANTVQARYLHLKWSVIGMKILCGVSNSLRCRLSSRQFSLPLLRLRP